MNKAATKAGVKRMVDAVEWMASKEVILASSYGLSVPSHVVTFSQVGIPR